MNMTIVRVEWRQKGLQPQLHGLSVGQKVNAMLIDVPSW
jgi:hypothetical protein